VRQTNDNVAVAKEVITTMTIPASTIITTVVANVVTAIITTVVANVVTAIVTAIIVTAIIVTAIIVTAILAISALFSLPISRMADRAVSSTLGKRSLGESACRNKEKRN